MLLAVAAVLVFAAFKPAIAADDLETCAMIPEDKNRLACYDRLMGHRADKPGKAADDSWRKNWVRSVEKSDFDDSENVFLQNTSKEKYQSRFKSNHINLMIACRENKTSLWFNFGGLFMSDLNNGKIEYRIDKQKPTAKNFRESNNHEALGLWNGGTAIPFIKQMFGGQKLLIRATPHSESAVTGEFTLTGLEAAIQPLREACHW